MDFENPTYDANLDFLIGSIKYCRAEAETWKTPVSFSMELWNPTLKIEKI